MTRAPSGLPGPPANVRLGELALDHVRRRLPGRPFRLAGDVAQAGELGALLAEPDAVAQRHVVGLDQIEKMLQLIDDDGADRLQRAIESRLAAKNIRQVGVGRAAVDAGGEIAVFGGLVLRLWPRAALAGRRRRRRF